MDEHQRHMFQEELDALQDDLAMHLESAHRIMRALGLGENATPPEMLEAIGQIKTMRQQWHQLARVLARDLKNYSRVFPSSEARDDLALYQRLERSDPLP